MCIFSPEITTKNKTPASTAGILTCLRKLGAPLLRRIKNAVSNTNIATKRMLRPVPITGISTKAASRGPRKPPMELANIMRPTFLPTCL